MGKEKKNVSVDNIVVYISYAIILISGVVLAFAGNWAAFVWAVIAGALLMLSQYFIEEYSNQVEELTKEIDRNGEVTAAALNDLYKRYETERNKRQALDNEYLKLVKEHEKALKASAASVPTSDEPKKTAKKKTVSQVKTSVKKVEEDLKS